MTDHFNVNAKLPSLTDVVKFALANGFSPRVVGLSIKEAANVVLSADTHDGCRRMRVALRSTSWPYSHRGIGGFDEFIVAVTL